MERDSPDKIFETKSISFSLQQMLQWPLCGLSQLITTKARMMRVAAAVSNTVLFCYCVLPYYVIITHLL